MTILFHHKCLPNEFYTPLIILAWVDYIGGCGVVIFLKFYYSFYIYKPVLFCREFPFPLLKISLCIHTFLFIYDYHTCPLFFFMDVSLWMSYVCLVEYFVCSSCVLLTNTHHSLCTLLLSETTECSRLILYFSLPQEWNQHGISMEPISFKSAEWNLETKICWFAYCYNLKS